MKLTARNLCSCARGMLGRGYDLDQPSRGAPLALQELYACDSIAAVISRLTSLDVFTAGACSVSWDSAFRRCPWLSLLSRNFARQLKRAVRAVDMSGARNSQDCIL